MTPIALTNDEIIQRDPLLFWFYKRLRWTDTRIIVTASLAAGILFFVIGGIASAVYQPADPKNGIAGDYLLFAFWTIIFSPIIWGSYLWQARTLSRIFTRLEEKGVFGKNSTRLEGQTEEQFARIYRHAAHPSLFLVALIGIATFLGMWLNLQNGNSNLLGNYWYEVKWYLPLYLLGWSLALFVLYVFVLRQIVFIADLSTFFRGADIQINPLDSDEVGGFAPVSQLISGTLAFLIGYGFLIGIFILVGYFNGEAIFERPDMLISFALYAVLAPFFLLVPTLSVRGAMLRARSKILAPIADEFRVIVEKSRTVDKDFKAQNERLKELQERYNTILETYPIVPLPRSLLRIFSVATSIPYLSGLIPIAIQLLDPNSFRPAG